MAKRKKKSATKKAVLKKAATRNPFVMKLRAMQTKHMQMARDIEIAGAELVEMGGKINKELAKHLRNAPAGYSLDLWGTGLIKPEAECKVQPDPPKGA